ncbi:DUF6015 family protein [[Eubacterium] cellulosolvens]
MEVLTLEDLRKALAFKLYRKGMSKENIDKLAEYLMNFFGYDDYVSDNKLNAKDRDVFYMLEEEGLLKTLRDEVTIQKGKVWRIHYWVLKKNEIIKLANAKRVEKTEEDKYQIYDDLSEEVWQSHSRKDESEAQEDI